MVENIKYFEEFHFRWLKIYSFKSFTKVFDERKKNFRKKIIYAAFSISITFSQSNSVIVNGTDCTHVPLNPATYLDSLTEFIVHAMGNNFYYN